MNKEEQAYFTKWEAAQYLRLSPRSIDYARIKGALSGFLVGRKLLFTRDALDTYAKQRPVGVNLNEKEEVYEDLKNRKP